jgi:uncharacterized protein YndB with AHSA1/START domain
MKITVATDIQAGLDDVWAAYSTPADIVQWNAASDDWHTPHSEVDLREGGTFRSRMEARDGSMGFDFEGTYTRVEPHALIAYRMGDGREAEVGFAQDDGRVRVTVTFDAESTHPVEMQREGWQAILDRFGRHVEAETSRVPRNG